ncbi:DUF4836 family protein [uncultured Prevotella sp.]|uniref:DUF4836 family protein n=1 Tax=uncultured Prevotella sp. TaxID=159272 RepID=UPI00262A3730|nr:DUF4836 family protein [uncultured Prevotella sp.]
MKTRLIDLKAVWLIMVCALCLASCRDNDYVRSIPASATAVMKIDGAVVAGSHKMLSLLPFGDKTADVIDLSREVYAFETVDGNLGMCARVKDSDALLEALKTVTTSEVRRQGDYRLADINNSWAVGFNDNALLVLGPVSAAALPDAQRSIVRMLKQDEDASIMARPMYSKLDSIDSRVAFVAQVQALPEKFAAPFMLGAPKGADASQVAVAAGVDIKDGIVRINCQSFSFDKSIDRELKKSRAAFRPIKGSFSQSMSHNQLFSLFANVKGKEFLPLLQSDRSLQAVLMGLNTVVDFDNIMRSVDGDLAFMFSGMSQDNIAMTMLARVDNPVWTADVDYWKQSCQPGCSITGSNGSWVYRGGDTSFSFGLQDDVFYAISGQAPASIRQLLKPSQPIYGEVSCMIAGNRMAMVLNLKPLAAYSAAAGGMFDVLKPIIDNVKAVVCVMK